MTQAWQKIVSVKEIVIVLVPKDVIVMDAGRGKRTIRLTRRTIDDNIIDHTYIGLL